MSFLDNYNETAIIGLSECIRRSFFSLSQLFFFGQFFISPANAYSGTLKVA